VARFRHLDELAHRLKQLEGRVVSLSATARQEEP
jgi:hypothetical protein